MLTKSQKRSVLAFAQFPHICPGAPDPGLVAGQHPQGQQHPTEEVMTMTMTMTDEIGSAGTETGLLRRPHPLIMAGIEGLRAGAWTDLVVSNWLSVTQPVINQFAEVTRDQQWILSLIHISEPTRLGMISYAVF